MWFEEVEEIFRYYIPYYLFIVLPIFIIVCPSNPVLAAHEFPVYRMQQYDLRGVAHGCRSAALNLEARPVNGWSNQRHCIVAKWKDITIDQFIHLRSKAGAFLIMLPRDVTALSAEERENFMLLEAAMLAEEISVPVYFAKWMPELESVIDEISESVQMNDLSRSALEAVISSVASNGYQFVVSGVTINVKPDVSLANIHGHLPGYRTDGKVPTIIVVAHYDSTGVAPELAFGSDSNASGVAVFLELLRLFSHLYSDSKTQGKYNIIFFLSGGAKLNYLGTEKWLSDHLDSNDVSILQDTNLVICLDSLSSSDAIYMHVSKPPKEGSASAQFYNRLKASADRYPEIDIDGVHKKINLAAQTVAWEHEQFSVQKIRGFTLSSVKTHKDPRRGSILDIREAADTKRLTRHAKVIAEAMASYIYNVTTGDIFGGSLDVDRASITAWLDYLSSQPRSPQLISNVDNPVLHFLKDSFNKYLRDVKVSYIVPDKRDPEFQFYEGTKGTMNVYSVKPAVFDLVLTLMIVSYLGALYFLVQKFSSLYLFACSLTVNKNVKIK